MRENAEDLVGIYLFFNAIMVIERGHRAPAYVKHAGDACFGPVKNFNHFSPVGDIFIRNVFHRGASDDQPVQVLFPHLVKVQIEMAKVFHGRVGRCIFRIAHARHVGICHKEMRSDTVRAVGQHSGNLRFRCQFFRHQVQQAQIENPRGRRVDILGDFNRNALG